MAVRDDGKLHYVHQVFFKCVDEKGVLLRLLLCLFVEAKVAIIESDLGYDEFMK